MAAIPADFRSRLETARLDLLALFRALDRMDVKPLEMLRDTLDSLDHLPEAPARFRKKLPPRAFSTLARLEVLVRRSLRPAEAYNMVPGRDPQAG